MRLDHLGKLGSVIVCLMAVPHELAAAEPAATAADAIASTNNNEPSITRMEVHVGQDGTPVEAKVVASSGSAQLDDAARTYVLGHWHWKPIPYPAVACVRVAWSLPFPNRIGGTAGKPVSGAGNVLPDSAANTCIEREMDARTMAPLTHASAPYDADAITRMLMDHH